MTSIVLTATAAILGLTAAAPAAAQAVEIRDAVARVVVIVEDRSDIGVEIEPGRAGLPALQVRNMGGRVVINGGLRRDVRNCRPGPAYARQPGEGASVELRNRGRIDLADASLIVIRSPRAVDIGADGGAVFGAVGPGATSIEVGNGGCGDWTVANTTGRMDLAVGGSGMIRAGTSSRLDASVGGSGGIVAGATGDVDASIGGSGSITIASVRGATDLAIGGSGDITVRGGSTPRLSIAIGGSGDIDFRGVAGDADVAIAGSGDVRIARVTGTVDKAVMGSGDVNIGN